MIPLCQPCLRTSDLAQVSFVLQRKQLTYGPVAREFERRLAEYLGVRHALVVSSGTSALHLALEALHVGPGDEVLVPDLTYVATANAVKYTGATPVLVDVNPKTWCIDRERVLDRVTRKTKAIIAVHLYGVACNVPELQLCGFPVIEDAAQGIGGSFHGRALGSLGRIGTFSFYGNKTLTTGEGGAVVTNDDEVAARVKSLRGQAMDPERRYFHSEVGYNYRMTEMQAALGCGQLDRLGEMLAARHRIFQSYMEVLGDDTQLVPEDTVRAPWLFTMLIGPERDQVARWLAKHGVETRPAFVPLHRMPMYQDGHHLFPNASRIGDTGLSLPTFADMTPYQVQQVRSLVLSSRGVPYDVAL